jgi:CRISPR-associated endonuclease/helicase Cas3
MPDEPHQPLTPTRMSPDEYEPGAQLTDGQDHWANSVPISPERAEELATEAEHGYDVSKIASRRRGRPGLGLGASIVESVRFDAELHQRVLDRAALEETSVSEIVREALRRYLTS